tara:strand:- start:3340 stop:4152 length:813 start_codon:yes stop_codon:yes gene_type:complete
MKVRESGNDYTADVAFDDDGFVSASSLVANKSNVSAGGPTLGDFIGGSNDGFVHTWYDQSGKGSNATDAAGSPAPANQPKIYSSGSLITDVTSGTARAALEFDTADRLNFSNSGLQHGSLAVFTTSRVVGVATQIPWFISYRLGGAGNNFVGAYYTGGYLYFYYAAALSEAKHLLTDSPGSSTLVDKRRLHSYLASTSQQSLIENGTTASDASPSAITDAFVGDATQIGIGSVLGDGHNGKFQEFIVYDSDQISNNAGIVADINTVLEVY